MFELAHRLVGIYKTSNCTKSIAIDNKELKTQALTPAQLAHAQAQAAKRALLKTAPRTGSGMQLSRLGSGSQSQLGAGPGASPSKRLDMASPMPLSQAVRFRSVQEVEVEAEVGLGLESPSKTPRGARGPVGGRDGSEVPPTPSTVVG